MVVTDRVPEIPDVAADVTDMVLVIPDVAVDVTDGAPEVVAVVPEMKILESAFANLANWLVNLDNLAI